MAQSDDERVTRDVLLDHEEATVVVVVDTKNLQRGLLIVLELGEAGVLCVLNLNMADEAATRGVGVDELRRQVDAARPPAGRVEYDTAIEQAIVRIEPLLPPKPFSVRSIALMCLASDADFSQALGLEAADQAVVNSIAAETEAQLGQPVARLQVTLLLALGVPCSAQLGVILGMIAGLGAVATALWFAVIASTLLLVGFVAARVIPGSQGDFILELPPMRMPSLSNILFKTLARMEWSLWPSLPPDLLPELRLSDGRPEHERSCAGAAAPLAVEGPRAACARGRRRAEHGAVEPCARRRCGSDPAARPDGAGPDDPPQCPRHRARCHG